MRTSFPGGSHAEAERDIVDAYGPDPTRKGARRRPGQALSELLRDSLEEKVTEATGYRQAMERQLRLLATGFDLGLRGKVTWSRDSVHERG